MVTLILEFFKKSESNKTYKLQYCELFFGKIYFILYKKRFGIFWPLIKALKPSKFERQFLNYVAKQVKGGHCISEIKEFTDYTPFQNFNNRPAWYWPEKDHKNIHVFYFNEFSEVTLKFAEYFI